jgi:hypothetical protein
MPWDNRFFMFLWRVGNVLWNRGVRNPVVCCLLLYCVLKSTQNSGSIMPWPPTSAT